MEVITIDGHQFVKASAAARQAGYTADYVGQLARAEAIPAKLIGRTWYVDAEALRTHRVEKKRFAREKAREQVKKAIEEKKVLEASPVAPEGSRKSFVRLPVYDKDEHDLIPKIEKKASLPGVEAVVVSPEEKKSGGEYTPLTVTVVETKNPLKSDEVESIVRHAAHTPRAHRQVIAPRKKEAATATHPVISKNTVKNPAAAAKTNSPEEGKVRDHTPHRKARKLGFSLVFFIISVPLAVFLATFEIHTIQMFEKGIQEIRTEYVINIGVFRDLLAELRQL